MKHRRFTNTALPVFSGAESWFQHVHIVRAIVKSNGWPEETAALQLFAHLKGEALNVALLLTREKRESWTGLVSGLAAYYQSLSRLAGLRRRFESIGPVCFSCGDGGHKVNRCPQVNADSPHSPRNWSLNCDNEQYRATKINLKLVEGPGNEQRSEREGQPLGPPEIKASLTQAGVSAEISNEHPIGVYRGEIVSRATGRPIVTNFRPWRRRGRPEIPRDQPVPVPPKWTGDRRAIRRRSSGIWTGGYGRLKTFSRFREGTVMLRRGESRRP